MKSTKTPSGITILIPKGRLTGGTETDELKAEIERQLSAGETKLVVDLGDTLYLNSTALGLFVSAHKKFIDKGGKMKLARVGKSIDNILVITKLSLVFEVFDSVEDAASSFS